MSRNFSCDVWAESGPEEIEETQAEVPSAAESAALRGRYLAPD